MISDALDTEKRLEPIDWDPRWASEFWTFDRGTPEEQDAGHTGHGGTHISTGWGDS